MPEAPESARPADIPTVERFVRAEPRAVFDVLRDGWSYASWVVGTARIRAVGETWPQPGSRLHHSFGSWPLMLSDETEVQEYEPDRRLVLVAKGRPLGEAIVSIDVQPVDGGSLVTMGEDVVTSGLRALAPRVVRDPAIRLRNTESLRRLALLAERATEPGGGGAG